MTDEQKYLELLKEVGEMLKSKNDEISYLNLRIEGLTEALKNAEKEISNLKG